MIFYSIVFVCAVCVMLLTLAIRAYEIKRGETSLLYRTRKNLDIFARQAYTRSRVWIVEKENATVLMVKSIPGRALSLVSRFNDYVHVKYGKHIDLIKGRATPIHKGSASFFVNAISEYKREIKEGEDISTENK